MIGLLYHKFKVNTALDPDPKKAFEKNFHVEIQGNSLFDRLKDKKMTEDIGIYYPNDLTEAERGKPESNKEEKRVITYQIQP